MTQIELINNIQTATTPVILISGTGLILLSVSNRYMKVIDRCRSLAKEMREDSPHHKILRLELEIMLKRSNTLKRSITSITTSLICTALLITSIFAMRVLEDGSAYLIVSLFSAATITLIIGLCFFLYDINHSLEALQIETTIPKN